MKNISLTVEYQDPIKELEKNLLRNGAKNISIRRNYDGSVNVSYSMACANPAKEIENLLTKCGGKNVHSSPSYNGGRFECKVDDIIDERTFKREMIDTLRRAGYRAN